MLKFRDLADRTAQLAQEKSALQVETQKMKGELDQIASLQQTVKIKEKEVESLNSQVRGNFYQFSDLHFELDCSPGMQLLKIA